MAITTKLNVSFSATIVTTSKEFDELTTIIKQGKAGNVGGAQILSHMESLLANYEKTDLQDEEALRMNREALINFAYKTVWRKAIGQLLKDEVSSDKNIRVSPVSVKVVS